MASPTLSPPPLTTALATGGGTVSQTWARWLSFIQSMLAGLPIPADWATVSSFSNSWAALGGNPAPRYKRNAIGKTCLGGALTGGTTSHAAFTLPAGFRPDRQRQFPCVNWTGAAFAAASVTVNTDGTVVPNCPTSNAQVWLDGIEFDAVNA